MLTSSILTALHVTLDYFIVINIGGMVILLVLAIVLLYKNHELNKKYKQFMTGENGYNLEKLVLEHKEQIEKINETIAVHDDDITTVSSHFSELYSKIHVLKYDAFQEMGGKLSFALTLLDGNNSGYIINSMHSREGCYNYIKEIVKGESYIELSEEEAESLERAIYQETLGFDIDNMK